MVKESFTTGNSEVSRRDMPSYLMRWLLVDKLQGEVTPRGSVRVCQKIIGFAARAENVGCEAAGRYRISSGGLRLDADFSEDEKSSKQNRCRGRETNTKPGCGVEV